MGDYAYIVLSIVVAVLNIAPLSWQVEHANSGPVCLGFWVILLNLNNFVNAVVWRSDAINRAPVWCDVSSKLKLGGPLGLLAANVCVTRFLARVVNPNGKMITARDRRNRAIFDYGFSLGVPLAVMATHIVYQPLRFGIVRTLGCAFAFVLSWPALVLWMIWSPILAAIAASYAVYVVYQLLRHRRNFNKLLRKTDSALTTSRFLRLALLSAAYSFFTLPLSIYQFVSVYKNSDGGLQRYSWETVHWGYYHGTIFYAPLTKKAGFDEYIAIISGILVVIFFGFSSESLSFYARLVSWWPATFRFGTPSLRKTTASTILCPDSDVHLDMSRKLPQGLTDFKEEDLEKQSNEPAYCGPFADRAHGSAGNLQISVLQHETTL